MSSMRSSRTNGASSMNDTRMVEPPENPYSNPTSQQLRHLVLNYLCHHSYVSTAQVLARSKGLENMVQESAKETSDVDADGDELMDPKDLHVTGEEVLSRPSSSTNAEPEMDPETLRIASVRADVRDLVLDGQIEAARQLLNDKFPTVLNVPPRSRNSMSLSSNNSPVPSTSGPINTDSSVNHTSVSLDPRHLSLNLSIQEFIESLRTIPLRHKPAPSSSPPSPIASDAEEMLSRAQQLNAIVSALPSPRDRAAFSAELDHVSALMAYQVPEKSRVAMYLSMERREALAEQINAAILYRTNQNPVPYLQRYVEHTTVIWSLLHEFNVQIPPASEQRSATGKTTLTQPRGPETEIKKGPDGSLATPFDFAKFVASKP